MFDNDRALLHGQDEHCSVRLPRLEHCSTERHVHTIVRLVAQVHGLGEGCKFDTSTPKNRAHLLLFVSNIYRVLLSLSTQLPDLAGAMPDNHWQERADGAAVLRMINKDGSCW